jgi:hypothetical protein
VETQLLGEPDISLGHFSLWVVARQFPDSQDEWDGNWLIVRARFGDGDASAETSGPVLDTVAMFTFRRDLLELLRNGHGYAALASLEPDVSVEVDTPSPGGRPRVGVTFFSNQDETRELEFEVDRDELLALIGQLDAVLLRFPVRNPTARGV